mgnify:CR=1 FL=1
MGEIAEQLVDQEMFGHEDDFGFKSIKRSQKRTPSEKKIASIRREIAIMVNEQNIPIQEARRLTNMKYGHGWRERGLISNSEDQWTEEELKPFK